MIPILPDPLTLHRAGVNTLQQAAVLIHMGRCGIQGTTAPSCADSLNLNINTVNQSLAQLKALKLCTRYARKNTQGRANLYVVTKLGWSILTQPGDFSPFPDAAGPMKKLSASS